jgi:DNA polymerase-3 subunit delta'
VATTHQKQWEFFKKKFESEQLAHAYLFTGEEGIGKKTFAQKLAEFVGCRFPDIMTISANEKDDKFGDGGEIKIARIREAQNFLSYKSYNGGYKIVIVDNAELMNQEAQSCFLKTLEEPKEKTLLMLTSSKPEMILSTIFSRCQQIKFFTSKDISKNKEHTEKEKEILEKLIPVLGADLAEKFKYVKSLAFEKQSASEIIVALEKYLRKDIIKNKKALELAEELNKQLILTNASPKLALEILLMET